MAATSAGAHDPMRRTPILLAAATVLALAAARVCAVVLPDPPPSSRHPPADETYTITATLQVTRPFNPADMQDDFQDVRVVAQDGVTGTFEVTYYPLHEPAIGANPNWRRDDA